MDLSKYLVIGQSLEVTVWAPHSDDDDPGMSYKSYIKDVTPSLTEALIDPPPLNRDDINTVVTTGVTIALVISNDHGVVTLYPKVSRIVRAGVAGYWLSFPQQMSVDLVQRRNHVRVFTNRPIRLRVIDEASGQPGEANMGKTHNLSAGGLRFAGDHQFKPGNLLLIAFNLEADGLVELKGRVVFSRENPSRMQRTGEEYVTAVRFENVDRQTESMLVKECFRLDLERQRREKGLQ